MVVWKSVINIEDTFVKVLTLDDKSHLENDKFEY